MLKKELIRTLREVEEVANRRYDDMLTARTEATKFRDADASKVEYIAKLEKRISDAQGALGTMAAIKFPLADLEDPRRFTYDFDNALRNPLPKEPECEELLAIRYLHRLLES